MRRIRALHDLDRPKARRIVVVLIVGTLISGAAAWLAGVDVEARGKRPLVTPSTAVDPLQAELRRCNELGQPALEDPGCRAAWAENRRRFLRSREEPHR